MEKLINNLSNIVKDSFNRCGYDRKYGIITPSNRPDLCQFQCNGALSASKEYKKSPVVIANEIAKELEPFDIFQSVRVAGPGFINLNINDSFLTNYLNDMYNDESLGCSKFKNPKTIIIDYGGANVAKPLHVGHLRSAIIGESIKRIHRYLGHNVIGDVHLGDWGLQMGMVISELKRRKPNLPYFDENFKGEYPKEPPFTIDELDEIYPAASKLSKENEAAMEEARRITLELQGGQRGYIALWNHILRVSVEDLKKNYNDLNVEFDLWKGESDSQKYIDEMIEYLKENNYTEVSQGALVVDISKKDDTYTIPPFILLKSDGASLYSTTDLATIWERVKEYNPDEIIYMTDKRQDLHFQQVFRCAKKAKIAGEDLEFHFIGFGTMNGKDGKPFKTREGGVMRLQDLIKIIKDNVRDKLKESKSISPHEREEIARKIGLSALKYGDLSNQLNKDYVFDIDKFSSFEGNTGPYILYTVVRIKSILRKVNQDNQNFSLKQILNPYSDVERDLMLKLSRFNEVIEASYRNKSPNKICEYIYDLSNTFNRFYHNTKIIPEKDINKKNSWISLITLTKNVLETGLYLLGIESPDKM